MIRAASFAKKAMPRQPNVSVLTDSSMASTIETTSSSPGFMLLILSPWFDVDLSSGFLYLQNALVSSNDVYLFIGGITQRQIGIED